MVSAALRKATLRCAALWSSPILFLFLDLLMRGLLATPLAVLLQLDLALHELLVLARPVVDTLALLAGELDELFLGHNAANYSRI